MDNNGNKPIVSRRGTGPIIHSQTSVKVANLKAVPEMARVFKAMLEKRAETSSETSSTTNPVR
jgi:hypothetical protein